MTDYSLFAQPDGYRSNNHERINQSVLTSDGRHDDRLILQLPKLNLDQSFPRHFFSRSCLPPQLANIRRTAERFIIDPSSRHSLSSQEDRAIITTANKEDTESTVFSDAIEDADFATCVLNNLPTSYDDFETKELHLKLEHNLSSPLITCQSPNTDSGRVSAGSSLNRSSNMHPCDCTGVPPDADDMEVAMINESFEEQQKQHKLYENPGLKDLFYSQPNVPSDEHKDNTVLVVPCVGIAASNAPATFDSGIFMANHHGFGVAQVQTSDVNDLLSMQSEAPHLSSNNVPHLQPSQVLQDSFDPYAVSKVDDANLCESRFDFVKQHVDKEKKVVDDNMAATEALAVDIVESLFANASLTDSPDFQDALDNTHIYKADVGTGAGPSLSAIKPISDAVDCWEELDNDNFDPKFGDAIQSAVSSVKVQKPKIDYLAACPREPWNDDDLPHVLEAYAMPIQYTAADVKEELGRYDCADVYIHPVDESRWLIVFSSANAALQALLTVRQQRTVAGFNLRSLCDATPASQTKAQQNREYMRTYVQRPQTTALIARRLIEGALGRRSNVSSEVIRAERKLLKDAKDGKQARMNIWGSTI